MKDRSFAICVGACPRLIELFRFVTRSRVRTSVNSHRVTLLEWTRLDATAVPIGGVGGIIGGGNANDLRLIFL